ncbi:hydroxypyruvate isomerase [Hydrogenophaga sp.]|uniref:hydroxypyruvate isomerase n=1 Tax=Hydrogenophaga sp. TaxID=1904254 RepID=UPI0025B9BD84|nr:hydroxypyruvate isomerase [Hydrogenophaga sp.]
MPRFAANLTMLYNELPFLDRFGAAAKSGFKAVEFLFPYDFAAEEIAQRLQDHGLQLVLHNLPAGNWAAGERGIACHPDRVGEFREGVHRALEYAKVLNPPRLNALAGIAPVGVREADARNTLVSNLKFAADQLGENGIQLLMEPINIFDIPGFFVNRTAQALAIMDEVASSNLYLQHDIYHAQRMEGELAATLRQQLARIGHIQLADNPSRNEPGTGEIHYRFLFDHLDAIGYAGHIGCEYKPRDTGPGGTDAGLGWVRAHGQQL